MLRRFSIVALLLLTVSSTGCLFRSRRIPQVTSASAKTATLDELLQFLNRQAAAMHTLNATVDIDTSVGGSTKGKITEYQQIRGYVLVRNPQMLRMIGLFPIVRNRAFDMVSDGSSFKLSIPAKNKFVVGSNEITQPSPNALENLRPQVIHDALLLRPPNPQNEIAVLENATELVPQPKSKKQVQEAEYLVDIIVRGDKGWYLARKIVFSRADLLPYRQFIYDRNGWIATDVRYNQFKDVNGVQFPYDIDIWRPQEEYSVGITVVKLTLNEPLSDDQFVLNQPAGSQLVTLGPSSATSSSLQTGGNGDKCR